MQEKFKKKLSIKIESRELANRVMKASPRQTEITFQTF